MRIHKLLLTLLVGLTLSAPIAYGSATPAAPADASSSAAPAGDASTTGEYSPQSREYHLKAAFLRYVAKFVDWPAGAITSGSINICILGLVPSFEAINSINGKDANDKTITITKILDLKAAKGHCHILFVSKTEEDNIKKIVSTVQDLPILTFGDMDHFAEKGGDMNFYVLNNRLAIMINPSSVEKAHLKIGERMLKVVTILPPIDQSGRPS